MRQVSRTIRLWWVAGALGVLMMIGHGVVAAGPAQAEAVYDYTSCGHFETQAASQEVLDSGVLDDPCVLDYDGNGIACEGVFADDPGSVPVYDHTSCGHFDTQASAQEVLDAGTLEDPSVLDADGDGIACERAFGFTETAQVTTLPATGVGTSDVAGTGIVAGTLIALAGIVTGLAIGTRRLPAR